MLDTLLVSLRSCVDCPTCMRVSDELLEFRSKPNGPCGRVGVSVGSVNVRMIGNGFACVFSPRVVGDGRGGVAVPERIRSSVLRIDESDRLGERLERRPLLAMDAVSSASSSARPLFLGVAGRRRGRDVGIAGSVMTEPVGDLGSGGTSRIMMARRDAFSGSFISCKFGALMDRGSSAMRRRVSGESGADRPSSRMRSAKWDSRRRARASSRL